MAAQGQQETGAQMQCTLIDYFSVLVAMANTPDVLTSRGNALSRAQLVISLEMEVSHFSSMKFCKEHLRHHLQLFLKTPGNGIRIIWLVVDGTDT